MYNLGGSYKVMKVSIWVIWWGSVGGTLLLEIHSPLTSTWCTSVVVVNACVTIGSTGLIVSAVPFGTDQLLGAPSEEISSLCSLRLFGLFTLVKPCGFFNFSCNGMRDDKTSLIFAGSSVGICIDILCWNWLVIVIQRDGYKFWTCHLSLNFKQRADQSI